MAEKLSAIMIEMAKCVLKNPDKLPSSGAAHTALLLASIAWNREVLDERFQFDTQYLVLINEFEKECGAFWDELRATNCETLITFLRDYKKQHYPDDKRMIIIII